VVLVSDEFKSAKLRKDGILADLAPTLLGFFGFPAPPDMQGHDLGPVMERGGAVREVALFGMHGAHICVTDGRYVLMRADRPDLPLCDYTLLPLRQRARCSPDELQALALTGPFRFTKGCKVLEIPMEVLVAPRTDENP